MARIAEVHIFDIPYQIDRRYSYIVPERLAEKAVRCSVAEVPFGKGNRKELAVIFDVRDSTPDDDPDRLKEIAEVPEGGSPFLSEDLLELCTFLKEHTLCTISEAVKCVLPSAAVSKIVPYYTACERGNFESGQAIGELGEVPALIYDYLSKGGRFTLTSLKQKFGESTFESLSFLEKEGLVKKIRLSKEGGTNIKVKEYYYPAFQSIDEVPKSRSERINSILSLIFDYPGITLDEIADEFDAPARNIRKSLLSLIEKDLIIREERDEFRDLSLMVKEESERKNSYSSDFELSPAQNKAFEELLEVYERDGARASLLYGVTGSGKTNVILRLIERALNDGKGVMMLVPEIALTPQTMARFSCLFGDSIAIIHSSLSAGERFDSWRRIRSGDAKIVIGTRSAIFAPVKDLGLIVIDEEHEHTYKSDTDPKYYTHDVASYLCSRKGAMLLLASATPSMLSFYKAMNGKYTLVELKERFGGAVLPEVVIADMRAELSSGNPSPFCRELLGRIGEGINSSKQTIVFLNRRGYNSYLSCRKCGSSLLCPNCSVSLYYHIKRGISVPKESSSPEAYVEARKKAGYLICHTCGYRCEVPSKCPECGSTHFLFGGYGTQYAEDELKKIFPSVRIKRMDHDTTRGKAAHEILLEEFRSGGADVLVGTQMVSKGHDFPGVTTVGVLNADHSSFIGDYRANERLFSMLTQVTGRAGRGDEAGVSVIQTFNPGSDIIKMASTQDYRAFYESEIKIRKELRFPPFCDIVLLTVHSASEAAVNSASLTLFSMLDKYLKDDFSDVPAQIFGPFESPIYKVQNMYRLRLVIKCRLSKRSRKLFHMLRVDFPEEVRGGGSAPVFMTCDFNPTNV